MKKPITPKTKKLVSENITIEGYPPLPLILAHFDAIQCLVDEVKKGTGSFYKWDHHRKVLARHNNKKISIQQL